MHGQKNIKLTSCVLRPYLYLIYIYNGDASTQDHCYSICWSNSCTGINGFIMELEHLYDLI